MGIPFKNLTGGIPDEILGEFKARMKISHSAEDDNLRNILYSSLAA